MSIAVIINPVAGGRGDAVSGRVELARRIAADCGEAAEVSVTEQPGHARALAKAAPENGARLIGVGEATARSTKWRPRSCSASTDRHRAERIGNGLARELGIAIDPRRALTAAMRARPRTIDVGEIDGRLFVNIAGLGLDAYIASQFNASGGNGAAWPDTSAARRALFQHVSHRYEITTAGAPALSRAPCSSRSQTPPSSVTARIAPAARVDDGALDLVVVEERSRLRRSAACRSC